MPRLNGAVAAPATFENVFEKLEKGTGAQLFSLQSAFGFVVESNFCAPCCSVEPPTETVPSA